MIDKNAWIQTHTGRKFYPLSPDVSSVDIEDIAHALSNICRFTGHIDEFYSVAQHSVHVAQFSGEHALWGLLHDASEAYIADISSPIKRTSYFEDYRAIEDNLMNVICDKYGLQHGMPESVRLADSKMLSTEYKDLMKIKISDWGFKHEPYDFTVVPVSPKEAKFMFLEYYKKLTS